jgi:L-ornithine N5-monooxygenase
MVSQVIDVLGIGFGPTNIAFAIAMEELWPDLQIRFLEARECPSWQAEMMLDGADIQHYPLRDLVTPRNPRSKYTFVNYLHEHGKLFAYTNLGVVFPLRKEYAHYISWVAQHFDHCVEYNRRVIDISLSQSISDEQPFYIIKAEDGYVYQAKSIIIATGRTPYIPQLFMEILGDRVFHLTRYQTAINKWLQCDVKRIVVVGASQSAVEIVLDLAHRLPKATITNILRGFGYRLKDTSPFMEEVFFPEFVDYFYNSSRSSKRMLNSQLQFTNYSAVDGDILKELYLKIYEEELDGERKIIIKANRDITNVLVTDNSLILQTQEQHTQEIEMIDSDIIILATGFRNIGPGIRQERYPSILNSLINLLRIDQDGCLHVNRDYALSPAMSTTNLPPIYLNGLCESSHGMGDAGSFGQVSLRAARIVESLRSKL